MAKELVKMGTHILAIKDMAGLCKPYAAYALVKALRDEIGVPIHFHTHDTSGINAASILRAAMRAWISSMPRWPMSGMTSQPNLNSMVAALQQHAARFGLGSAGAQSAERLLGSVREFYYPFEEE
jgi:pyruvate carboxylase